MRFLLLIRDGNHPLGVELVRLGHDVVVASGTEVTAATLSLVDVLVVESSRLRQEGRWLVSLCAQARAAEVGLLGLAGSSSDEELSSLLEAGVEEYLVQPCAPAEVEARVVLLERRRTALQRRQTHEESARGELERMAAIIQTQNDIALAGLDLETVMRLIAERAQVLCSAMGAAVGLIEGEELVYRVCTGSAASFQRVRVPLAESLGGASVLEGQVLLTDDTERDSRVQRSTMRQWGVRSMITVPLRRDTETVGVLNVISGVPYAFIDWDVRTLELMAGMLGAAMGNAAEHAAKQSLMSEVATIVAALQESQHRFESFMNNSAALAYMKDEQGRRIWVNEPYRRFFGLSDAEEVASMTDERLMPPEPAEHVRREDQHVFETGRPTVTESMIPAPDGTPHHWSTNRFIARDSVGRRFLGGVSFDITERKRAEEALRSSEGSFRALIENSPEAIFVHAGGPLLYVNPAACAFLKQTQATLVGRSLLDFVLPEDRAVATDALGLSEGRGQGGVRELRFLRPDSTQATGEVTSLHLLFNGKPATLVSARDLTERKMILGRLVVADRLASVGTMASGIAHEINNPLAFVISNISFLTEEMRELGRTLPAGRLEEVQEVLRETNEGLQRVRHIVQNMRAFSRGDEEQPSAVHLSEVVERALSITRSELRHRARVVKDLAEVPPVEGSVGRLSQVLVNLLMNAAYAIEPGQQDRNEVRLVLRSEGERVVLEVRDTGCGIPREVLGRIFDPFFTTKPVGTGTGLGLSICHGIITSLRGEITVDSVVGKGSTFRISLPVAKQRVATGTEG